MKEMERVDMEEEWFGVREWATETVRAELVEASRSASTGSA
jgi:hypothetical protein